MGSKRTKISKRSMISRVDRISDLPDVLLIKILSFLPFDLAVRTSTLSKRWTPLCLSLYNLHFHDEKCRHFLSGVNKFLMNRDNDFGIEEFGLKCDRVYDPTLVNTWIRKALEQNVKCMSLGFSSAGSWYKLIPDMYTYGRFEVLRLKSRILVDVPSHFCFQRLKILEFYLANFSSCESVENLLLNCPVLEDLVMKRCESIRGCRLTVSGYALKNLTLKTVVCIDTRSKLKIVIDTPALETLKIKDSAFTDFYVKDTLLSLKTAHTGVRRNSVFRLLDNIFHVQSLTLTDEAVGVSFVSQSLFG